MKGLLDYLLVVGLFALRCCENVQAQGLILFTTRDGSGVDASVTYPDGRTPPGPTFNAQLYGGPAGAPIAELMPLYPTTVFGSVTESAQRYVVRVIVRVEGILPGERATFFMRAFNGPSWDQSTFRGQSEPFVVTLGDTGEPGHNPPALPRGLNGFYVYPVPEPSLLMIGGVGVVVMMVLRRSR
jgi:hypothetical protein